jgi:hypothetical protein
VLLNSDEEEWMTEGVEQLVSAIDTLSSVTTPESLTRLQELSDRYFAAPEAAEHLAVWFRLYERFPEDDGYGLFWSILHGIETLPRWERLAVESVRRRPSHFPLLMVIRLLNSGVKESGGQDLMQLLRQVAADERCLPSIRLDARGYLDYQQRRGHG